MGCRKRQKAGAAAQPTASRSAWGWGAQHDPCLSLSTPCNISSHLCLSLSLSPSPSLAPPPHIPPLCLSFCRCPYLNVPRSPAFMPLSVVVPTPWNQPRPSRALPLSTTVGATVGLWKAQCPPNHAMGAYVFQSSFVLSALPWRQKRPLNSYLTPVASSCSRISRRW